MSTPNRKYLHTCPTPISAGPALEAAREQTQRVLILRDGVWSAIPAGESHYTHGISTFDNDVAAKALWLEAAKEIVAAMKDAGWEWARAWCLGCALEIRWDRP
jgi:hypothetical protein